MLTAYYDIGRSDFCSPVRNMYQQFSFRAYFIGNHLFYFSLLLFYIPSNRVSEPYLWDKSLWKISVEYIRKLTFTVIAKTSWDNHPFS